MIEPPKYREHPDVVEGMQFVGTALGKMVTEAMWPFRCRHLDIYMGYDIDYHEYLVTVGFVLMSGYTISFSERVCAWQITDYYDREVWKIANSLFEKFRRSTFRPEIPSNITLGEN